MTGSERGPPYVPSADRPKVPTWLGHVAFQPVPAGAGDRFADACWTAGAMTIRSPGGSCEMTRFGAGERSAVVFDGYLYDRGGLAADMEPALARASNARLAAACWTRWGPATFERLRGGYLLAVYDDDRREFFLGRDALGLHPVYCRFDGGSLWFSSNLERLAWRHGSSPQINAVTLAMFLAGYRPPPGETFFQDVTAVGAGSFLRIGADLKWREVEWWRPVPRSVDEWLGDEQVHAEFEPRLRAAIDRCMQLQPRGVLFSGGIDSAVVLALANEHCRRHRLPPPVAFSARGPSGGPITDEEAMQDSIARSLGVSLDVIQVGRENAAGNLVAASLAEGSGFPQPTQQYWCAHYMGLWRHVAATGVSTVLTGAGGDEWLSVHSSYFTDLLRRLRLSDLHRFIVAETYGDRISYIRAARRLLWSQAIRVWLTLLWDRLAPASRVRYQTLRHERSLPDWLIVSGEPRRRLIELCLARKPPGREPDGDVPASRYLHVLQHLFRDRPMPSQYEMSFLAERRAGIRSASPYNDVDLVEFLLKVPPWILFEDKRYKGMLRRLASRLVPGVGLDRQRKWNVPVGEGYSERSLKRDLEEIWRRIGCNHLARLGFVDPDRLAAGFRSAGNLDLWALSGLFGALSAELWCERVLGPD